jgi:hypothetical protein
VKYRDSAGFWNRGAKGLPGIESLERANVDTGAGDGAGEGEGDGDGEGRIDLRRSGLIAWD